MKKYIISLLILVTPLFSFAQNYSDHSIKEQIVKESIAQYSGNCPCPYNSARNGSRCGKRSAYSRPGGYSPRCYVEDVSDKEVQGWKKRNNIN